jgi:GGDEF domain-containing protein
MISPPLPPNERQRLATSDALTGVSNLRGFLEIGHHVLALASRFGHSLQLLVVKIPRVAEFYRKARHRRGRARVALKRVEELLDDLNVYRSKELRIVAKVVSETFEPKRHGSLQDLIAAAETRL